MTTYNTGNPIGSTDSRDRLDNSENFDKAINSIESTWDDRLGATRDTLEGALSKLSFYRVGTFAAGYTLTNMRQTLEYSGHEYSWAGSFPKNVAAGATPTTSGGVGVGAWVDRTDVTFRGELASNRSSEIISGVPAVNFEFLMKTTVLVTEERFTGGVDITNGTTSAVSAMQAAIDYVSESGGGIVDCGIRGARYLIDGGVIIKAGTWVRGVDFPVVDYHFYGALPTILVTYGKGSEEFPAFRQNQGSRISGFSVEYPDQVLADMKDPHTGAIQSEPYKYGWFLTLNNQDYGVYNIDAASCGNMFLKNPYNAIRYYRCGKYDLHGIYGQPLRRGLWVDGVLDVSRQSNIHWWTYHAVVGSGLYNWIINNAEAYLFGRADQVSSYSLFAYGYLRGRYFINLDYGGGWWGDFYGCLMDVCLEPLVIESVNKVNDYGCDNTTALASFPCMKTTTGNMTNPGIYEMHGGSLGGGSNIGALISSLDGTFIFNNVNFGNKDSNGLKGAPVVVEGTATVRITGGKRTSQPLVGGIGCFVDDVQMPSLDGLISLPTDPNIATSWSGSPTQSTGSVQFTTTSVGVWDYVIPAAAKGNYIGIVEMDLLDTGAVDKFLWLQLCRSDGDEQSSNIYTSTSGISGKGDWIKVRIPIFQGQLIDEQVLRVQVQSYNGVAATVSIRNLKFYASLIVKNSTAQKVIDDFCSIPSRFCVQNIDYKSGYREMLSSAIPGAYNARSGDKARNIFPVVGSPKGWVYALGTGWISEGNL